MFNLKKPKFQQISNSTNSDKYEVIVNFIENLKSSSIPSIVNESTSINGEIKGNVIEIFGHFTGKISSNFLFIRETGFIEGDVFADYLKISGKIKGKIKAKVVVLCSDSEISSDIEYGFLIVEDGVVFNGNCVFNELLTDLDHANKDSVHI